MPKNSKTIVQSAKQSFSRARGRVHAYKDRRPHRSFRLTRRRDYMRSLKLPGYFAFTGYVNRTLWKHRKIFAILGVMYAVLSIVLVGIGSQETYTTLTTTLSETSAEVFEGNVDQLGQAGLLFLTIGISGLSGTLTEGQQIYAALLGLLVWLTTVWLLRNLLAGHKVRTRDGLYNAGGPLVSTFLVALLLVVQLLPIGLAIIGYSAATASGLLDGGVEAMLFWIAAVLLVALSLYWMTSTFFAMIMVTLPGMYPMRAVRTAGDMILGRRLRVLARLLWMLLSMFVTWAAVLIPVILLDTWLKSVWPQIQWLPVIPVVILLLSTFTIIWSSSYVYLLYRRVVDDDAQPA
ncbi:MAG: hypothetical protein WAV04_03405 [Candidatus Microsaccharimonas sp.]